MKKNSLPIFLSALCVAPVYFICINLGKYYGLSYEKLGEFAWFFQIYNLIVFFPGILVGFLIAKLNENINNINKVFKLYFLFGLLVVAFLILSKSIIFLISGFEESYSLNLMYYSMTVASFLYILSSSFSGYWLSVGKPKFGFYVNLIWALLTLILSYIIIKNQLDYSSIFIGTSISYFFVFLLQYSVFKRL